jgi:Tfp pilus assembly protein PilO
MKTKLNMKLPRLASLFAGSEESLQLKPFLTNLLWNIRRLAPLLGRQGIVAIFLLGLCIPFYYSTLRPMQATLDELKRNLESTQHAAMKKSSVDLNAASPIDQLVEFYEFFPSEKDLPHWLGLMAQIADSNGLALNHGDYSVTRDTVGQLQRLSINLPVEGTYPQIRRYLAALTDKVPYMSLESVQFERKNVDDTQLQARIKLALYLRRSI